VQRHSQHGSQEHFRILGARRPLGILARHRLNWLILHERPPQPNFRRKVHPAKARSTSAGDLIPP
jgi:hypothetical protein